MKFGSFLLGGLVGAAAVVYFNNKSKSMLLSAFSGNHQSLGKVMDKTKDLMNESDSKGTHKAANTEFNKSDPFNTSHLGAIQDIVQKDPELKSTVNEILAESHNKDAHNVQ